MARTHQISAYTKSNRKSECYLCGKLVTPEKAKEWCEGRSVSGKKRQ